jgi:hypothetical protein
MYGYVVEMYVILCRSKSTTLQVVLVQRKMFPEIMNYNEIRSVTLEPKVITATTKLSPQYTSIRCGNKECLMEVGYAVKPVTQP